MMIGTQPGGLTGGRGSQCPESRTHEPVPCQLCSWHNKPQPAELGVEMHREPLCGGSAVGSEGKAGAGRAIPGSSGLGIWGWDGFRAWAWPVIGVVGMGEKS